jgi:hypothetical protein
VLITAFCLTFATATYSWIEKRENKPGNASMPPSAESTSDQRATLSLSRSASEKRISPQAKIESGPNAANLYKNALSLYGQLTEQEKETLTKWHDLPDAETAKALAARIRPILELLHQAAKEENCDWSLGSYSFFREPTQLSKMRPLVYVALWDASYQFTSDSDSAFGDLQDLEQLGHNLCDPGAGAAVELGIERAALKVVQLNAASFDGPTLERASAFVADTDAAQLDFIRALLQYDQPYREYILKMAAAGPAERQSEDIQRVLANIDASKLNDFFANPSLLNVHLDHVAELMQQFAQALTLPDTQYQAWWSSAQSENAGYPLNVDLMSNFKYRRMKFQGAQEERALLAAGLDILRGNSPQSPGIDPQTGTPFTYIPTTTGFDLKSAYILLDGKPVTMSFTAPVSNP